MITESLEYRFRPAISAGVPLLRILLIFSCPRRPASRPLTRNLASVDEPWYRARGVRAEVSGALRVLAISIEPALFASGDREMLQDLTAAAVNAAIANAQRLMQEEMQKASTALGLPLAGSAKPA